MDILDATTFVSSGRNNITCAEEQRLKELDGFQSMPIYEAKSRFATLVRVLSSRLSNETFGAILKFSKSYEMDYQLIVVSYYLAENAFTIREIISI